MTRRLLYSLAAALTLAACTDAPTNPADTPGPQFITGNFEEDFAHPWVGLIAFYKADGTFSHRCSGSLISPTKFLTAGHCTDDEAGGVMPSARIWFRQDAGTRFNVITEEMDPLTGYPDTCIDDPAVVLDACVTAHTMFNYGNSGFPDTHDAGVVILDAPVTTVGTGVLADVETLDPLANSRGQQDVTFVSSGYGISQVVPATLSFRERLMATSKIVNLGSALTDGFNVQTSANPGDGRGGTCSGDSGGPLLYQGEIVGLTSFGLNRNCKGVDFAYRIDRQEVQDWIDDPS
jgi:secreted trypsin-like serine protease